MNDLGVDFVQGYLIGRPAKEIHYGDISAVSHKFKKIIANFEPAKIGKETPISHRSPV